MMNPPDGIPLLVPYDRGPVFAASRDVKNDFHAAQSGLVMASGYFGLAEHDAMLETIEENQSRAGRQLYDDRLQHLSPAWLDAAP